MHTLSDADIVRLTNARIIIITNTPSHTNPQTGPITIHCAAASLARSVMKSISLEDETSL